MKKYALKIYANCQGVCWPNRLNQHYLFTGFPFVDNRYRRVLFETFPRWYGMVWITRGSWGMRCSSLEHSWFTYPFVAQKQRVTFHVIEAESQVRTNWDFMMLDCILVFGCAHVAFFILEVNKELIFVMFTLSYVYCIGNYQHVDIYRVPSLLCLGGDSRFRNYQNVVIYCIPSLSR